ncbi:MAG: ribonuclease III [Butyrivibrio sp.]|nr:ribonuclease III [Acetatifactor muris]MCM1560048.1 ribonuclease III [Butyrivibrio sp.]
MEEGIEQKRTEEEKTKSREAASCSLLQRIGAFFPGKTQNPQAYSPLVLAYIGDAFYDLIIRTVVVERANRPVRDLHRIAAGYVNAGFQAKIAMALLDRLTEEESAVYRRGRNAKPHTKAKNASMEDYLKATGFEAVLGYLYLSDNTERALELVRAGLNAAGSIR